MQRFLHQKTVLLLLTLLSSNALAVKMYETQNWGLTAIEVFKAQQLLKDPKPVTVALIDTGVDIHHQDLTDNIWSDPLHPSTHGWDFVLNLPAAAIDLIGHGTNIAGIIAAIDPQAKIMVLRYYNGNLSNNLLNSNSAITYAIENHADIINYSSGGVDPSTAERELFLSAEQRGITTVMAAGNEGTNLDEIGHTYFPASYRIEGTISVASVKQDKTLLWSSNVGVHSVDIAAPGFRIYSTFPGNVYASMSGTSQATAFVTGVVALLKSCNPKLSPKEIRHIIINSALLAPNLIGKVVSGGEVNAYRAILYAKKYHYCQ